MLTTEAGNVGHKRVCEIQLDPKTDRFVVVTNFGTFKLEVSQETPVTKRQLLGLLDVLNERKAR